jgi:hypothetical protein
VRTRLIIVNSSLLADFCQSDFPPKHVPVRTRWIVPDMENTHCGCARYRGLCFHIRALICMNSHATCNNATHVHAQKHTHNPCTHACLLHLHVHTKGYIHVHTYVGSQDVFTGRIQDLLGRKRGALRREHNSRCLMHGEGLRTWLRQPRRGTCADCGQARRWRSMKPACAMLMLCTLEAVMILFARLVTKNRTLCVYAVGKYMCAHTNTHPQGIERIYAKNTLECSLTLNCEPQTLPQTLMISCRVWCMF